MTTTERRLARVEAISDLRPIEGADLIECARVLGWDVVVAKGDFALGDTVVYFEVDAALPLADERFAKFAERGSRVMPDGSKAHVLRTIKLRGQVSQGLVMGLDELGIGSGVPVGTDLTEVLGITKWEPPMPSDSGAVGTFPTAFAAKTDSERVQNLSDEWLASVAGLGWVPTLKVDGSSLTVAGTEEGVVVASRNWAVGPYSVHHRAAAAAGLLDLVGPGMAVQGEVVGPGIQSNRLRLNEVRVVVFDLWQDRELVARDQWPRWAAERAAPVLDIEFPTTVEQAVAQADGLRTRHFGTDVLAEGIVWHLADGADSRAAGRATFKAINNRYLLKNGE